jgi:hypothetical protein
MMARSFGPYEFPFIRNHIWISGFFHSNLFYALILQSVARAAWTWYQWFCLLTLPMLILRSSHWGGSAAA